MYFKRIKSIIIFKSKKRKKQKKKPERKKIWKEKKKSIAKYQLSIRKHNECQNESRKWIAWMMIGNIASLILVFYIYFLFFILICWFSFDLSWESFFSTFCILFSFCCWNIPTDRWQTPIHGFHKNRLYTIRPNFIIHIFVFTSRNRGKEMLNIFTV